MPLEKWRTFESDAMPMHDWLFNQEYNLEQCLGEEGLASVFSVTNWRYAAVTLLWETTMGRVGFYRGHLIRCTCCCCTG